LSYILKDIMAALPVHKTKRYKTRALTSITHVVVHHSATTQGTAEAFARYHVGLGWPGCSYHYVIDKQGVVFKCQPASRITWHAANYNGRSIGICMVGNFDIEQPTEAQKATLLALLKDTMRSYNIPSSHVVGHREVPAAKKSCPGRHVKMDQIRSAIGVGA
jgi:N-acetylmuramoyl-L-alanine amidase